MAPHVYNYACSVFRGGGTHLEPDHGVFVARDKALDDIVGKWRLEEMRNGLLMTEVTKLKAENNRLNRSLKRKAGVD